IVRAPGGCFCQTGTRRSAVVNVRPAASKYTTSHDASRQKRCAPGSNRRKAVSDSSAFTVSSSTGEPFVRHAQHANGEAFLSAEHVPLHSGISQTSITPGVHSRVKGVRLLPR